MQHRKSRKLLDKLFVRRPAVAKLKKDARSNWLTAEGGLWMAVIRKSATSRSVESKPNLTVSELRKALRDFGKRSRDADVAVVYYAGHGPALIRGML